MERAIHYIQKTIGIRIEVTPIINSDVDKLPLYILELFSLQKTVIFDKDIILAELKNPDVFSVRQTEKHLQQITNILNMKVVIVLDSLPAYNRKRLIDKRINFIVPDKQLYMPSLLIDLRETNNRPNIKSKNDTLLPSAQLLLIYHIIHRELEWKLEEQPFKEIARKLGYTPMAITNAIDNLNRHELLDVRGGKEKYIHFKYNRFQLWQISVEQQLLVNPVFRTVFVDGMPNHLTFLKSNFSALTEYSDLSPSRQDYFAVDKNIFYGLKKANVFLNENNYEGNSALELWKYDPTVLVADLPNSKMVVDPLSLYLSMRESKDERIEMALDQILDKYIW